MKEDGHDRPVFPYNLLAVEPESGLVLGSRLLLPIPSLEDMRLSIPTELLSLLADFETKPKTILVQSEQLFSIIEPLVEDMGITLGLSPYLPALEEAKAALLGFLR